MKIKKLFCVILATVFLLSLTSCRKVNNKYGVVSEESVTDQKVEEKNSLPEITSLDNKMAQYFDISLFDEENYADIYMDRKFEIQAVYANSYFSVPTTMEQIAKSGWKLVEGSDYDENSLVYAKETVELKFQNEAAAQITALFYNSSNSSVRLSTCDIVKFRVDNGYLNNKKNFVEFNVNGVTNTAVITDVIQILGTPSHFYKKTENTYYFDYFLQKRDRRNKIRVFVDLEEDAVTAVEFSNYK